MFHAITWQQFFVTIGALYLIYYFFIGAYFYRKDVLAFLKGGRRMAAKENSMEKNLAFEDAELDPPPFDPDDEQQHHTKEAPEAGEFIVAYELAEELKALLREAGYRRLVRPELVQALKSLVGSAPYAHLAESSFRNPLSNLIETETMRQCMYELTAEELSTIWTQ